MYKEKHTGIKRDGANEKLDNITWIVTKSLTFYI